MKKIVIIILAALLVLCGITGLAEANKYSSMTNDELLQAILDMTDEALTRGLYTEDSISQGTFEVGVDIKADAYTLVCIRADGDTFDRKIRIYENREEYESLNYRDILLVDGIGSTVTVNLKDGEIINIGAGTYSIKVDESSFRP